MTDEDYEILPHKLLADLRDEVDALKKKLSQPDSKMNELILEIETLKDGLSELNEVFRRTLEQVKGEDNVLKDIRMIVTQNETIAKGMIAISDKLEDFMSRQGSTMMPRAAPLAAAQSSFQQSMAPPPFQHTMGLPPLGGQRMAPYPRMPNTETSPSISTEPFSPANTAEEMDFPPPPPSSRSGKKLSLFR